LFVDIAEQSDELSLLTICVFSKTMTSSGLAPLASRTCFSSSSCSRSTFSRQFVVRKQCHSALLGRHDCASSNR
jgi:hypothetical protein